MQTIMTENFGELEYDEAEVIHFPVGIPGYPDDNNFIMREMEDTRQTFFWLQSIDDGEVCFPLCDVFKPIPDYDPHIEQDELTELGEINGASLAIYCIAVIPDDISQTRVNMRAPVIINLNTRIGKQIVCNNEDYAVRHYIMEQLRATNFNEAVPC